MSVLLLVMLSLFALAGILLSVLQLPGTWLIIACAIGYDWYHGWQSLGWQWLVGLGAVAVVAELIDSLAAVAAVRRAGASRRAAVGSLIGGFSGMILLSLPVPILGTIAGGLLGCFLGALVGEMTVRDDLGAGARAGLFATLGRVIGMMAKTAAALMIAGATVSLAVRAVWLSADGH